MGRFVDAVHAIARETKAAVHSFVGDTVTVTWNAGLRAAQHETKAVTFLCQLRDRLLGEVAVCGACTTGPGRHMMAGSVLQAMLVRVEWLGTLRALCSLASKHGAILLCGETDSVAKFHVVTRFVDVVPETAVYEALNVRVSNPNIKEEWMYSLDTVLDPVSRAVEACQRGDYEEAEAALAAALPSEAATVRYLARKIRACLDGIGIPFSNVQCHPASKSSN